MADDEDYHPFPNLFLSKPVPLLRQDQVVRAGVAVCIVNDNNEFLMIQRAGSHSAGTWSFPGGWMDFGESPVETAKREVLEEVGITLDAHDHIVRIETVVSTVFEEAGKHSLALFYKADLPPGEFPIIKEPEKISDLRWVPRMGPYPQPLFEAFELYLKDRPYVW